MSAYDINGNIIANVSSGGSSKDTRSILHQGYHVGCDGNSKTAFTQAYTNGFTYVEADINVTSDGVLVMSHDSTASISYEDWKTSDERLSFDDFLWIIKKTGLMVYLDGKAGTQSYMQTIYDKIIQMSLLDNFIFMASVRGIKDLDSRAKCVYDIGNIGTDLTNYPAGSTLYCNYVNVTQEEAANIVNNGYVLELYTLSTQGNLLNCIERLPQASRWCTDNISVDAVLAGTL